MHENQRSLNNGLSPNSFPYWNYLHDESHTSFMTEYNYLNYRAGCGSRYCVLFPDLRTSSSLVHL